jgi:hypothetical protein
MSVGGSPVITHGSVCSRVSSAKQGVTLFYAGLDPHSDFCCGLVGRNRLLFCTKKKASCQVYVQGGRHCTDRANVSPDLVYIDKNSNTAWFSQCVEEEFLTHFATAKGTLPVQTNLENKIDVDTKIKNLVPISENNIQSKLAVFIPDTTFEDWKDSGLPQSLIDQVKAFSKSILDLTSDVDDVAVTLEFCASAKDVAADILSISALLNGLKASIGDCSNLQCPDLKTRSTSMLNEQRFEGLFSKVNNMELEQSQASTRLEKIEHDWSLVRHCHGSLPSVNMPSYYPKWMSD